MSSALVWSTTTETVAEGADDVVLGDLGVEEHLVAVARAPTGADGHPEHQALALLLGQELGDLGAARSLSVTGSGFLRRFSPRSRCVISGASPCRSASMLPGHGPAIGPARPPTIPHVGGAPRARRCPRRPTCIEALRAVIDPELGDNVVDLGMVLGARVSAEGTVEVDVALTIAGCPLRAQIERDVTGRLAAMPGVRRVAVHMAEMDAEARAEVMSRARWKARENAPETGVPASTRILAVGSGKGGVGKSSITVNLAVALARRGLTVGVLDADIWGFSVPRLLGMEGGIEARKGKMIPLEQPIEGGLLKVLSMGFLADEDRAIMWRGLVLNRAVQQFLEDAEWGRLDYLLVDLPPGHRRCPDGTGPDAPPHRAPDRHHAAGGRPEGGLPGGRHGRGAATCGWPVSSRT